MTVGRQLKREGRREERIAEDVGTWLLGWVILYKTF